MSSSAGPLNPVAAPDPSEQIRRSFAAEWAATGEAWGIPRSTAAVQGYLLLHGGPLTETDLRAALGLSHKAAFEALAECARWGLIEPAGAQRTGARGPAGRAWVANSDPWGWFRRVAASRLERESGPILPLVEATRTRVHQAAPHDADLVARLDALAAFATDFDGAARALVAADPEHLARLAGVLAALDEVTVARLLAALAEVPPDELATAARHVAAVQPSVVRRLARLAANPALARILDRLA